MSQMGQPLGRSPKPRSNVYTVLVLIAVLVMAVCVGLLWWANTAITGNSNPTHIEKKAGSAITPAPMVDRHVA